MTTTPTTNGFTPSTPIEEIGLSQLLAEAVDSAMERALDGEAYMVVLNSIVDAIHDYVDTNYVLNKTAEPDPDEGERDSLTLTSDFKQDGALFASVNVVFDYPKDKGMFVLETIANIGTDTDDWGVEATKRLVSAGDAEVTEQFNAFVDEEYGTEVEH